MLKLMRKGQSTAEYAIVIALVIAAAVAMQIYIKRKLQGKVKDAVDYNEVHAGTNWLNPGEPTLKQYDPYYETHTNITSTSGHKESTETFQDGKVQRTVALGDDKSTRVGTTNILDYTTAP